MKLCYRPLIAMVLTFSLLACRAQTFAPIPYAHAHNDYEHERPLLDALDHGFTSIEADVFAIDGDLYVYHNRPDQVDPARTLKQLYLEPLRERISKNNGQVYPGYDGHFQLMIDIKTDAAETYSLISRQLQEYASIFSRIEAGREVAGPVMVFLSGNRPIETILQADTHIARLDGRPDDVGKGYTAGKMPVISERYGKVLQWDGTGKLSAKEKKQLRKLIKSVHREGKQLRLWAMPESESAWKVYRKLGIDWINADDLARLQNFFSASRN
ncbi:phosphatidylinositol-specific phospholipase C/glycerophosphodiester phosphodiesterase family protein [Flavilitoribacter nigricans]|uniref:Altered inheritance of mitochondria protein 6 n=1 Tax=Flavilitoribacter nigricans (strain ATCC 23147 / DSM 23189 / NBRC 102662 / NCIMB 1420 / SS-2) TaxID=1122177 RepID=A0A2D0NC47_FLAN2|nr:phosphatidylinositol-specific phospholipase C/glycerophosphodiester phosphodiesterase family protein [Flavilitoribacter nigricans]PHN05958.1 hypothetical protein CRP01_13365 [Flavilitoribacter nigricans DSM 23189 = NBRC 102662]